jgi:hypothetical protein
VGPDRVSERPWRPRSRGHPARTDSINAHLERWCRGHELGWLRDVEIDHIGPTSDDWRLLGIGLTKLLRSGDPLGPMLMYLTPPEPMLMSLMSTSAWISSSTAVVLCGRSRNFMVRLAIRRDAPKSITHCTRGASAMPWQYWSARTDRRQLRRCFRRNPAGSSCPISRDPCRSDLHRPRRFPPLPSTPMRYCPTRCRKPASRVSTELRCIVCPLPLAVRADECRTTGQRLKTPEQWVRNK